LDLHLSPAVRDSRATADAGRTLERSGQSGFRILKVTQSYYPFLDSGGPAVKVRAIARGLANRGYEVTVLTSDLGIKTMANRLSGVSRVSGNWQHREDGVESVYLAPLCGYRSLTWNRGILEFCNQKLDRFDLVHIYGTYDFLGPVVARACRNCGIPYVFEPMGMFRPIVRHVALKQAYLRILGGTVVRGASRVIATSDQERGELIEEGIPAQKVVVRRNGIEFPPVYGTKGRFRQVRNIPPAALMMLFLGRIVAKKSPELLLNAFAQWRSRSMDAQSSVLVFAGPFESSRYRRKLRAQATRLGLDSAVVLTGALYDEQKWSALRDADVFVLPSQNENFGNAAAEAIVSGTPVIVTNRCGIAPLIQDRAGLVIAHECEALVRALGQLSDAAFRERLKLGCVEVSRELTWEQPLAELEALYSLILRAHTPVRRES
jgi:glycosyltransferase involved in cell wall biosynthesis